MTKNEETSSIGKVNYRCPSYNLANKSFVDVREHTIFTQNQKSTSIHPMAGIKKHRSKVKKQPLLLGILLPLFTFLCIVVFQNCQSKKESKELVLDATLENTLPDKVDFNFHVRPILSDRCFKCHGPDRAAIEADLSFATEEAAKMALGENKDHFAIVPGDPKNSTMIQRIFSDDPDDVMPTPESNLKLTDFEKEILKRWVEQGAEWKTHWAYTPPQRPDLPEVKHKEWAQNEIDLFILEKLEEMNLQPSAKTSKEKLLRRASFDLRGLPPSTEEIDAFLADKSTDAFSKALDKMFSSPDYAERMALDWMDVARYADTHGYQDDFERIMWPWRDWVIHAFQKNMPYDDFVTWQLAGDLLPDATKEQIIATGFNRNHKITAEGGVIPEEYRTEYVADRTHTFGTAFLGLTMECARCHDHKYDPLSQKDYFSLFSFFNNMDETGLMANAQDLPVPHVKLTKEEIESTLTFINNLDTLPEIPLMVMKERSVPRPTFVLKRGQYDQPSEQVEPSTPEAVLPLVPRRENQKPNRLDLSDWLFAEQNPLTARVAVNRLWQQLFGTGLVATSDDFGSQGNLPSHPELLDFLAIKYREEGWDTQAMLKYIMSSTTYQQSSKANAQLLTLDPENRWLARAPRRRLQAEMLRDQVLAISGLLNETIGGPSVKPYQPPGLWAETTGGGGGSTAKYVEDTGDKLYRKSLYTFWKRTVPPPSMMTMDASSRDLCTVKRQATNTPLQALVQLNDPQIVEASRVLSENTMRAKKGSEQDWIAIIFRQATSRLPNENELKVLTDYFAESKADFSAAPKRAEEYLNIGASKYAEDLPEAELAALTEVTNMILNLDEAMHR